MMKNKYPHKFKHIESVSTYTGSVYCEYCGHIAFHANTGGECRKEAQRVAKEPCPNNHEALKEVDDEDQ